MMEKLFKNKNGQWTLLEKTKVPKFSFKRKPESDHGDEHAYSVHHDGKDVGLLHHNHKNGDIGGSVVPHKLKHTVERTWGQGKAEMHPSVENNIGRYHGDATEQLDRHIKSLKKASMMNDEPKDYDKKTSQDTAACKSDNQTSYKGYTIHHVSEGNGTHKYHIKDSGGKVVGHSHVEFGKRGSSMPHTTMHPGHEKHGEKISEMIQDHSYTFCSKIQS